MQLTFKKLLRMQSECLNGQCYQILKLLYRSVPQKVFLLQLFEVHSGVTNPSQHLFHAKEKLQEESSCLRNIQRHEIGKRIGKGKGKDFLYFSSDDLNESGVSVTCQRISA